jgi:hypothetical protein
MKKLSIIAILSLMAAAFAVAAVSCKKDKTTTISSATDPCIGMLHFNSSEEFVETQQKVLAMTVAERREWEQQQGFKSYATKCEELFEEFEANGINSDEDIYNFVKENPDYFYIREEEGELYLTSYLENLPCSYLVNEKQLIQSNDKIIKAFANGYASLDFKDLSIIDDLKSLDDCIPFQNITVSQITSKSIVKKQFRQDNTDGDGRERTLAEVYITNTPVDTWESVFFIRPYKKTLGVWYYAKRTITGEMVAHWRYKRSSADQWWPGEGEDHIIKEVGRYAYSYTSILDELPWVNYYLHSAEYTMINGWADTESTPVCYCLLNAN